MLQARPFLWSSTFLRLLLKIHSDLFHSRFIILPSFLLLSPSFRFVRVTSRDRRRDATTTVVPGISVPIRLQQVVRKRIKKFPYPNSLKIFLVLFQLFLIVSYPSSSPSFLSVCLSIVRLSKKKKKAYRTTRPKMKKRAKDSQKIAQCWPMVSGSR